MVLGNVSLDLVNNAGGQMHYVRNNAASPETAVARHSNAIASAVKSVKASAKIRSLFLATYL